MALARGASLDRRDMRTGDGGGQRRWMHASCLSRHRSQALLLRVGSLSRETFFPAELRPVSAMGEELDVERMS